jgi:hypothetical protein
MNNNDKKVLQEWLVFSGRKKMLSAMKDTISSFNHSDVREKHLLGLSTSQRKQLVTNLEPRLEESDINLKIMSHIHNLFSALPSSPSSRPTRVNASQAQNVIDNTQNWNMLKNSNLDEICVRYLKLKEKLISTSAWPNSASVLQSLTKNLVNIAEITPEEFFIKVSDKPMFANTRVETGVAWHRKTRDTIGYSLENWSQNNIDISYLGGGAKNKNFEIKGNLSERLKSLGIASSRFWVTQNLARFAIKKTDKVPAFKHLRIDHSAMQKSSWDDAVKEYEKIVENFVLKIGTFFGHITAMHCLTDFGGFVKPDLWLTKSVNYLTGANYQRVPNPTEAAQIAVFCLKLLPVLHPEYNSMSNQDIFKALRELDFILLELGRQGVLPKST